MTSAMKMLGLVERLQSEVTQYVGLHEGLLQAYERLLEENERLKDTIAIMAEDNYHERPDTGETN